MDFFRFFAALVLVGLIAVAGVSLYNAGVSAGIASDVGHAIASGAPVPAGYVYGPDRDQPRSGHRAGLGVQPGGTTVQVTRVAVSSSSNVNVSPPPWDPNDPPVGLSISSASGAVGGRQLTVTFGGAPDPGSKPCGADYTAEAAESPMAVVVIVIEHRNSFAGPCLLVGATRTATVQLASPLGDRAVLEVKQGLPVPVTLTP